MSKLSEGEERKSDVSGVGKEWGKAGNSWKGNGREYRAGI